MSTVWVITGCVVGALAAVVVWTLLVALVVSWMEEHRNHRHVG